MFYLYLTVFGAVIGILIKRIDFNQWYWDESLMGVIAGAFCGAVSALIVVVVCVCSFPREELLFQNTQKVIPVEKLAVGEKYSTKDEETLLCKKSIFIRVFEDVETVESAYVIVSYTRCQFKLNNITNNKFYSFVFGEKYLRGLNNHLNEFLCGEENKIIQGYEFHLRKDINFKYIKLITPVEVEKK